MAEFRYTYAPAYQPGSSTQIDLMSYDSSDSAYDFRAYDSSEPGYSVDSVLLNYNLGSFEQDFYQNDVISFFIDFSDNKGFVNVAGYNYDDIIFGGSGNDALAGEEGNDILVGGGGVNSLRGGSGEDFLTGGADQDFLYGGEDSDNLRGMGGADRLFGDTGSDRLVIFRAGATADGGEGNDKLFLQGADSFVFTLESLRDIETVYVSNGSTIDLSSMFIGQNVVSQSTLGNAVIIIGTSAADVLFAGKGLDSIGGGGGDDIMKGASGNATLRGDQGNDRITLGTGGGAADGGANNDTLKGGSSSSNLLSGGADNDRITAGTGEALIDGGDGSDKLFAGSSSDTFQFRDNFGRDDIYKFDVTRDTLDVSAFAHDMAGLQLKSVHNGADTQITFVSDADLTHKIILHGVIRSDLVDHGHFTFGS